MTLQFNVDERKTILLVEDDGYFASLIEELLGHEFRFILAKDRSEALSLIQVETPDLILMDLFVGEDNGLDIFHEMRFDSVTQSVPAIFLSGMAGGKLRAKVLESGAKDFLAKPVYAEELLIRVRRALEESPSISSKEGLDSISNLSVDLDKKQAFLNEQKLDLTVLELDILLLFVQNTNRLLSRNEILETIWKDVTVTSRTVDTHVSNLRKKLSGFNGSIKSRYGGGYILECEEAPIVLRDIERVSHVQSRH